MKRSATASLILLGFLLAFAAARPASAHPADVYTHSIHVTLARDGLSIKWEIKPGPMLVSYLWFEADTDKDDVISAQEEQIFAEARASQLTATLDKLPLPLTLDEVDFPSTRDGFQAGAEFIVFHLSAGWPQELDNDFQLSLHNRLEEQKSLNWYFFNSEDGIQFRAPEQQNSSLTMEIHPPNVPASDQAPLLDSWDSSLPSIPVAQGGQQNTAIPEPAAPTLQQNARQEMLLDLIRNEEFSISFFAFALAVSLVLGALHALTPGHGKTVVAAYLVGSRGTTWHAIVLGTVVTLTHTGSVFLLGLITLAASQYILPTSIIPILEILSGLLIVGLGLYLLWQRFQAWRRQAGSIGPRKSFSVVKTRSPLAPSKHIPRVHSHLHEHNHDDHQHDHAHEHGHSHEVPETLTWRSLIALGVSGGLVPCPDAIAILLVAVAINRILLGLALILSFSLGLALVLIIIGLLMVNSRRLFDRMNAFSRLTPILPMISALVVVALGIGLTYGAYARAKEGLDSAGAGSGSVNEAQVLYLLEGQDNVRQLLIANVKDKVPTALSEAPNSVVDYALSPDQTRVAYILQNEDLENEIWLSNMSGDQKKKLTDCMSAICSGPVWSPDGNGLVYEQISLSDSNSTGLPTLWWVDMRTNEAKPVFQESQLPGANPRWSPDGAWLSYSTSDSVRLYNLSTGESRTIDSLLGTAANWSPDSKSVLYRDVIIQDNQFITQLFVYDLSSQATKNISPNMGYENILAAWSPDGEWIAVVRRDLSAPRGDQIWVMRADGSDARSLTSAPAVLHGSLNWSPDGRYLLYDVYLLDSFPLESSLQTIELESGEITDLEMKGYNPRWVWP